MPLLAPVIATTVGVSIPVMTPTLPGDCQGTLPRVVAVTAPTRSRSAVLRTVLLDVAPPLVGYYGLRACGASEYVALLTATVLSGLKVTHDAVKARRLDPFACYLLLTFGLSLAVALATTDPKLILAGNTMVNGIGGLLFLGSCIIGTPLTQVVAERVKPTDDGPEPGADEFRRKRPRSALGDVGWGPAHRGRRSTGGHLAGIGRRRERFVSRHLMGDGRPAQRRDNPGRAEIRGALGTKESLSRLSASG